MRDHAKGAVKRGCEKQLRIEYIQTFAEGVRIEQRLSTEIRCRPLLCMTNASVV